MMDTTKVLNKIVKTFEHTNDVAVESCDEYMVTLIETTDCFVDLDDPGKNHELCLAIEFDMSNDFEYHIYSYFENDTGEIVDGCINRRGNGLESFCKDLSRSYELEDDQVSDWKSPRLMYRILSE